MNDIIKKLLYLNNNNLIKAKDIFLQSIIKYYRNHRYITREQDIYITRILKDYDISNVKCDSNNKGMKKALINGKSILLKFNHPKKTEFLKIINNIKKIPKYIYRSIGKTWRVPISIDSITILEELGFKLSNNILDVKNSIYIDKSITNLDLPKFCIKPFNFQKEGILFIEQSKGRTLIADDMGLGKTLQSIIWTILHKEVKPVICLVPSSLKIKWSREIKRLSPESDIQIIYGQKPIDITAKDYIIINYRIFKYHIKSLLNIDPKIFIIDECHKLKNKKGENYKSALQLGRYCNAVIGLSGTPVINNITELWSILQIIKPGLWSDFWGFMKIYCDVKKTEIKFKDKNKRPVFSYDFSRIKNTDKLNKILKNTVMLRRLKTEVLTELPEKRNVVIPIKLNGQNEYIKKFKTLDFKTLSKRQAKNELENLKQLIIRGKIDKIIKWIDDFLISREKLIIFTTHHWTIDTLFEKYKKIAVKMDGRDSADQKQIAIDSFQTNEKIKLIFCNLKSGGLGHDLTAASNVLKTELGWTSSEHDQAGDRANRIGQKNAVTIWYMIAVNTIEEYIMEIIDKKRKISDAIIDGKISSDDDLLLELLNKIQNNLSS